MIGMNSSQLRGVIKRQGFTIVELLVVVVVIGILSVITVVSYTGITQQANVARMQVELESAYKKLNMFYTENDTYPVDLSAAKDAKLIPTDSKTNEIYVADNSVNPAYYCYSFTTGTETYAIDSLSSVSKGGCLTNLITNGDLAIDSNSDNIADGLTASNAGSYSCTANVQKFTATATNGAMSWSQNVVSGHKYYAGVFVKVASNQTGIRCVTNVSALSVFYTNSGAFERLSMVVTATATGKSIFKVVEARTSGFTDIQFKYASYIDLTATFGAGNEPTAAQMDAMLAEYPDSWFDGTKKGSLFW